MADIHQNNHLIHPHKLGRAGMASFISISQKWDLSVAQQIKLLGDISPSAFFNYKNWVKDKKDFKISKDMLERISYILGIYKSLNILLPSEDAANQWIHKPNSAPLFSNKSALNKMLAGNVVDLADVRRFLDGQRGSIYF